MDAAARLRDQLGSGAQHHDAFGILHGTGFLPRSIEQSWTWDTAADPHGTNSDGTTVRVAWDYDHPVPRPTATIGGAAKLRHQLPERGGTCYGFATVRDRWATRRTVMWRWRRLCRRHRDRRLFIERAQDHPSWLQDNAASIGGQWFADGRPLTPIMDISDAAISVSGQLYRLTSTTTDGDNLSRVGYNIYVVKVSPTSSGGGAEIARSDNPCPIWNDTILRIPSATACTITLNSGSGTICVSRIYSGGLGVTYTSGLSISTDTLPGIGGDRYSGWIDAVVDVDGERGSVGGERHGHSRRLVGIISGRSTGVSSRRGPRAGRRR